MHLRFTSHFTIILIGTTQPRLLGVPTSEVGYTSATAGGWGVTTKSERTCGGVENIYIYISFLVRTPVGLRWTLPSLFYCNQQSKFIRGSILGSGNRFILCSRMFAPVLVDRHSTFSSSGTEDLSPCLEMTTNLHIVPNSSVHGAITPLPHEPAWCIEEQVYVTIQK